MMIYISIYLYIYLIYSHCVPLPDAGAPATIILGGTRFLDVMISILSYIQTIQYYTEF